LFCFVVEFSVKLSPLSLLALVCVSVSFVTPLISPYCTHRLVIPFDLTHTSGYPVDIFEILQRGNVQGRSILASASPSASSGTNLPRPRVFPQASDEDFLHYD